ENGMILPVRASRQISQSSGAFNPSEFSMRSLPVSVTLTNATIMPIVNILHGVWNTNSFRTDYIAAAAYIDYFFNGNDDFSAARARINHWWFGRGIPELIYETPDFYYTARFAASFPEFADSGRIADYIRFVMATEDMYPRKHAAALLALAAVGEPVLFLIQDAISELDTENLGSWNYSTALYLAAALVAIGDDHGAMDLIHQLPNSFEQDLQDLSVTERETINTLMLYVNAVINPHAAWDYLDNLDGANQHVSDVAERINFVRRVRVTGGTISEIEYFLNGDTHRVRLEDFDRVDLHLSRAQFNSLNLTPIRGLTNFDVDFYGYNADNWSSADERVTINRNITLQDNGLYRIDLHITLPEDAAGFFTINDRMPSNLRFVPLNQTRRGNPDEPFFFVRNTQRQLIEISLHAGQNQPLNRTVTYYAMALFSGDMAQGTSYISNRRTDNHIWGRTR
ncbi:MAG: hypothetical protein FWD01_01900, partial [Defluviitaleaceae bacterium]|nr:hypothetical protein [Defluviitaleaceae bacterium]